MIPEIREFCEEIAIIGAKKATVFYKGNLHIEQKIDKSYVSNADTEIEHDLRGLIKAKYPDHNIFGEEEGSEGRDSSYNWYLDPIDGTSNFIFGIPLFGTSIAVTKDNELIAASIVMPLIDLIVTAAKDQGVQVNQQLFKPNPNTFLEKTTMVIDCGKSSQARSDYAIFLSTNGKKFRSIRQFGCVSAHTSMLPTDNLNFSMIISAPPHDLFPLATIYKEAGFITLNRYGGEWSLQSSDLIACKKGIAEEIVEMLKNTPWK